MGISYDAMGKPLAYFVGPVIQPAVSYITSAYQPSALEAVPASMMLHVFDSEIGSSRGWPIYFTGVGTMRGVDTYARTELAGAELNARHFGVVQRDAAGNSLAPNAVRDAAEDGENAEGEYDPEAVDSNTFQMLELPNGASYSPVNSGSPRAQYSDFEQAMIRTVSRSADVPYSSLSVSYTHLTLPTNREV